MGNWGRRNGDALEGWQPMEGMDLLLSEKMRWSAARGRSLDPLGSRRRPDSRRVSQVALEQANAKRGR